MTEDVNMEEVVIDSPEIKALNVEDTARAMSPASEKEREKQEWVKQMRLKFCVRPEFEITKNMIYPDGTLNQE